MRCVFAGACKRYRGTSAIATIYMIAYVQYLLLLTPDPSRAQCKDDVCSPGGCTMAGVHVLEKAGFRGALMDAVEAATKRAQDLGEQ